MDGVRKAEGGVRDIRDEYELSNLFGNVIRPEPDGEQCGSCDARDGERIRSRELSRTGLARNLRGSSVVRWVGHSVADV